MSITPAFSLATRVFNTPKRTRMKNSEYQTVGILGGGSAGYLAALALKRSLPYLQVTIIESSKIPIIGVGEATTPLLAAFLHGKLGLDIYEFYRCVLPTWKLGIRFEWGLPGDYYFNYPFDKGFLLESYLYENDINLASIESLLMSAQKSNLFKSSDNDYKFWPRAFAYHMDNQRFVEYLKNQAAVADIKYLDREIVDASIANDGETVQSIITQEGEHLHYDLFVDCSGFRSVLLEQKLAVKFVDYQDSLFNDTAIAATLAREGNIRPYTTARTMQHGWCWYIPLWENDHIGYVFSSAHCSVEAALSELKSNHPLLEDIRVIQFRPGRHQEFWKGNVVSIGNAYAFLEPLESTALHMACLQLSMLIDYFPATGNEIQNKTFVNQYVNACWDELRWFLAIHFKFNHKLATPYWQDCQQKTDISGAEAVLSSYQERGPLAYRHHLATHFYDDYGFDVLLMGQQVLSEHWMEPTISRENWSQLLTHSKALTGNALSNTEMRKILLEQPEILRQLAANTPWLKAMSVLEGYPSGRYGKVGGFP